MSMKNKNVLCFAGCLVLALAADSVSATHRFVSAGGTWAMTNSAGTMTGEKYSSLSTAVAAAVAGDTVWVKDGFVWSTGQAGAIKGGTTVCGYARIKLANAVFTLRSESGYVDERTGKGAYIRGGEYTASGKTYGVRPVWSQNKGTVIQGMVLEDGKTDGSVQGYSSGGAMYGSAVISNCLVRNCSSSYFGGAFYSGNSLIYNTTIANCHADRSTDGAGGALYGGASLYNCLLMSNTATRAGGAIGFNNLSTVSFNPVYSGCVFVGNSAQTAGCAEFSADGKRVVFNNCRISDNKATDAVGGIKGMAQLNGCVLSGNKSASGAAAFSATTAESCYNCLFSGNASADGMVIEGPLALYNCTVAGNSTTNNCCANGVTLDRKSVV